MKFKLENANEEIMRNIFIQISKYSNDEIIITDDNFNVVFHNSKFINNVNKASLFDITSFVINNNIKQSIIKFKNSENNHIFFKLIIKEDSPKKFCYKQNEV